MRTILNVMYPEKQQKPVQAGVLALWSSGSLTHLESVAMPSLFLHRISVVCVNLSIAATTHEFLGPGSASELYLQYIK